MSVVGADAADGSRRSRELIAAVWGSSESDPFDDPTVASLIEETFAEGAAARVALALAGTAEFALDRLRLATTDPAATWTSLAAWREDMQRHAGIDPDLVADAFALLGAARTGTAPIARDHARRLLSTWGRYGLIAQVLIVLRIANTIATVDSTHSTDELIQQWALADESVLAGQSGGDDTPTDS